MIDGEDQDLAPEIEAEAPVAPEPEAPARDWTDEDEAEARLLGWTPKDEFGNRPVPSGYMDNPRAYLDRAMTIRPFRHLKSAYDEELKRRDAQIAEVQAGLERIHAANLAKERERIRAEMARAVKFADEDAYGRLQAEYDRLPAATPAPAPPPQPAPPPPPDPNEAAIARQWHERNQAIVQDPVMYAAANALFQNATGTAADRLRYVDQKLREEFPHKFRAAAPKVEGGLPARKPADPLAGLPASVVAVFRKNVAEGLYDDTPSGRAEWRKLYDGGR